MKLVPLLLFAQRSRGGLKSQNLNHSFTLLVNRGATPLLKGQLAPVTSVLMSCLSDIPVGNEDWSVPAGLSAVTINNEHKPPCVCGTAEGLALPAGCARDVGSLLTLCMSNFHSVVFSHTWCSGMALRGERKRKEE